MRTQLKVALPAMLFVLLCVLAAGVGVVFGDPAVRSDEKCRQWTCQGTVSGYYPGTQLATMCTLSNTHSVQGCFDSPNDTCVTSPTTTGLCPGTVPGSNPPVACEARYIWCTNP